MARKMTEWASEHAHITNIGLSDGYGEKAILTAVQFGYDRHGSQGYLGNVSYKNLPRRPRIPLCYTHFCEMEIRMAGRGFMHSEIIAWVIGAVVVLVAAGAAYAYVGGLGIGLVGLVGLLISTRLSLHGGHAVADSGHGSSAVGMYAKQIAERTSHTRPEERMAAQEEKAKGSRAQFLINTAFIGMMALGLGLFFLHQI